MSTMSSKKRHFPLANVPRLPLKETSGNIPSPQLKRARVHPEAAGDNTGDVGAAKPAKAAPSRGGRLLGDELVQWQQSWRKIMRELTVYFEGATKDSNPGQVSEFRLAAKHLKQIGCQILAFYDSSVTIIISRRKYEEHRCYPPTDIFSHVSSKKIKVWDYDKVFRFLKNLGVNTDDLLAATGDQIDNDNNLYTLLKEEKIYGATERDPNAKRDDLHYLEKNYLFVYDLNQKTRPVAVREWSDDQYPRLHNTLDGKCPFIADKTELSEKRKQRRQQKFEMTRDFREVLKAASQRVINGEQVSSDGNGDDECTLIEPLLGKVSGDDNEDQISMVPPLPRELSCVVGRSPLDVAALGYNGALNAVLIDLTTHSANGGNGLGPIVSQVTSRNLNNLKRRIIKKKQQQQQQQQQLGRDSRKRDGEYNPGYCENCRIKYDHFDDHIRLSRHRRFAADDRNFEDIDALIATLRELSAIGGSAPSLAC